MRISWLFSVTLALCSAAAQAAGTFYVDPDSNAARWVREHPTDGRADDIDQHIARQPAARWLGDWTTDVRSATYSYTVAARDAGAMPILVAYNIPLRDCNGYSGGGAPSAEAYRTWIAAFAGGIGKRKAVVVLEPDALPQLDCLEADKQAERLSLLNYAVRQFKNKAPNAKVYLDIGHADWLGVDTAVSRLVSAGVGKARGFSLNVSNYKTTEANASYGRSVAAGLASHGLTKAFVIDTSRNGNGPLGSQWCDPPGRRLGAPSTMSPDVDGPEMTLWVKNPGDADGCAADAGVFVPELAYKLIYGY
jgi:endoglucanase